MPYILASIISFPFAKLCVSSSFIHISGNMISILAALGLLAISRLLFVPIANAQATDLVSADMDLFTVGNSSVSSVLEEYTSLTMKSCVTEALEKRLRSPRHLIFGDIDMVVGFTTIPESAEIEFTILAPTHGWFGFGVSEVGSMVGADIAVIEPGEDGTIFELTDRYSKEFKKPTIDKIQSWELLSAAQETVFIEDCDEVSITTAVVRRMLDTCDAEDEKLTPEYLQNYFIAAYGEDDQKVLGYHPKRASIAEYVHVPEPMIPKSPKGGAFDILTPPVSIFSRVCVIFSPMVSC